MADKQKRSTIKYGGNGTSPSSEAKPWATADALRNNMGGAEYKHVVLCLIFLHYISDAFEAQIGHGGTFGCDPHPGLRVDYVIANLHFNGLN